MSTSLRPTVRVSSTPRPAAATPPLLSEQQRAAEVLAVGLIPIRLRNSGNEKNRKVPCDEDWTCRTFRIEEWRPGEGIGLRLGEQQPDDLYLHCADVDQHGDKPWQNAHAFLEGVRQTIAPHLWAKLFLARSTGGHGRYIMFRTCHSLQNGKLFDTQGRDAGEFLSSGRQVVCPTDDRLLQGTLATIPLLTEDEAEVLLAACGYRPGMHRSGTSNTGTLPQGDDQAVQYWLIRMDRGGRVVNHDGVPRKIKPGTWAYKLLTGLVPNQDRSRVRYRVIEAMIMCGYRNVRIIAFCLTYLNDGKTAETPGAILKDIHRCINIHRAAHPNIVLEEPWYDAPHLGEEPVIGTSRAKHKPQPKPRGLPALLSADEVYQQLPTLVDGGNLVMMDRHQLQAEFGMSRATLDRRIKELIDAGRIIRHTSKDRRTSWLEIVGVLKNPHTAPGMLEEVYSSATEETPAHTSPIAQNDDFGVIALEETRWGEDTPTCPTAEQAPLPFDDVATPATRRERKKRKPLHDPLVPADLPELHQRVRSLKRTVSKLRFQGIAVPSRLAEERRSYERLIAVLEAEQAARQPMLLLDALTQARGPPNHVFLPYARPLKSGHC